MTFQGFRDSQTAQPRRLLISVVRRVRACDDDNEEAKAIPESG